MNKLNFRVSQTVDRLAEQQSSVETEMRRRLQLLGAYGIVSADGGDVGNDDAACSLRVNAANEATLDIGGGTVVFKNGEYVEVGSAEIVGLVVSASVTDAQLVRLEYGEVSVGSEKNPYTNFMGAPKSRKKTAAEMLVVETVTAYNAQTAAVKERSVVLGVARFLDGVLTLDNGRDTYSFARPWFSPTDTEHRSYLGTGVATVQNPHATSANDLSVGSYSLWQAFVGGPGAVLARPMSYGRIPGELCTETVPAGNFVTDPTGRVTGIAGALYAPLGVWPERLLSAVRSADSIEVAAWIPKGRNIIAVRDPFSFASAQTLVVNYTRVTAASLPGSVLGLTSLELADPTANEGIVAGGNFFSALTERKVSFSDVGLIPMAFDVMVDGTGRVYKRPDVIYCNTRLETLGASPVTFTIQPRSPSRLRVAISNFSPSFTEVRIQITGQLASGLSATEQVSITGPLAAPTTAFTETTGQRRFTQNVFASVTQLQVLLRNGDGANTTLTVFAEQSPERPETQDDLVAATVFWTGSEVSANYTNGANTVLDRRQVTAGGAARGLSGVGSAMNQPMLVESILGSGLPSGVTAWATIVEDFGDPQLIRYPQADATATTGIPGLVELPSSGLGASRGYSSRRVPFGKTITFTASTNDAVFLRMVPRVLTYPMSVHDFTVSVTLYSTAGTQVVLPGTLSTSSPPFQVDFGASSLPSESFYAMSISIPRNADASEVFQGFVFHARG